MFKEHILYENGHALEHKEPLQGPDLGDELSDFLRGNWLFWAVDFGRSQIVGF